MWQSPQTIIELLKRNVTDFAAREAVVSVRYRMGDWVRQRWQEVDEASDRVAGGLAAVGVKQGQKVAFMLTNSIECYHLYLGIHKLGAVFVPINVRLVPREVSHIVANSDADFIVAGAEFLGQLNEIREQLSVEKIIGLEKKGVELPDWAVSYTELIDNDGEVPPVTIRSEDVADILYTSGTTGLPKGVVLTEGNKVSCGKLMGASFGFSRLHYGAPTVQNVFPFFTSSGCSSVVMMWLYYGFRVVLEAEFDVESTLETMAREKSTCYGGAPAMFIYLLSHPKFKEFDTTSLNKLISGAAAMPEEVIRKLDAAWPGIKIFNSYALTEAGTGGTTLSAADAKRKIGSIGNPLAPYQEFRIVDNDGKDMPIGKVGQIVLRGPNIMKEYYKNPEATAEALRDGWLYTGDMGYCDSEGYLYYTDRAKDMIVRGGNNVYSVEVESVLYEHPAVKQCAVLAKPHAQLGEDILAFVVMKDEGALTAEELHDFTTDKLADYKRPRDIRFVDALPLNPTGKIDKKRIRAELLDA
ncbi:long-chain fatty acid--CoA ligase [Geothermobacter hydrogeniphilus]|uniref:Long-chain fatty acid--CoA ligase n=1 Tax=Geothermobacter hydrogeniphilus TaxID=1969733 RepID=A0A2K2H5N6_9BACT|nr:class I adenylate-forming enzyme family protein [Geothermobacter hydrogeniphilus]PNU18635.1 long-chain fatty acid--CoA ligase [Geothermobacter hydrogeniphilus]